MILPDGRSLSLSERLLQGAIDIHVHAGPHLPSSPRRVNPIEAALEARAAGMRAINYMDVFLPSVGTAWLVQQVVPDFPVFGGIILNTVYGGMNARAVKTALYYGAGARHVSFGAHSTYFQASTEGRLVDGEFKTLAEMYPEWVEEELSRTIRIPLDEEPDEELDEILTLLADHPDVYLDTGHVSPEEALRLLDLAGQYGIKKTMVSSAVSPRMTIEQLKQAAEQGALLEWGLAGYTHSSGYPKTHYYVEPEYSSHGRSRSSSGLRGLAEKIRAVGAQHCIISTDFGVFTLPSPVEGMLEFIACLLDLGITEGEIRMMNSTNPARLLGLDNESV